MNSDNEIPGRKFVPPTEALIHTVEPTTTTSTKPVAVEPIRHSRQRSNSIEALTALTSPHMSSTSSLRTEDYGITSQPSNREHGAAKTDESGYEPFPSFDSWAPRPRFSLTRSLSLRPPQANAGQGRTRLFRSLSIAGPSPAAKKTPAQNLESEADRIAWIGEALSRTHLCLWPGPWRRRPSGEYVCPCGEHSVEADNPRLKRLEDKMQRVIQGNVARM